MKKIYVYNENGLKVLLFVQITPRTQNALAYVNAGFRFRVDKKDKFKILEHPTIVFGRINPAFVSTDCLRLGEKQTQEGRYVSCSSSMFGKQG